MSAKRAREVKLYKATHKHWRSVRIWRKVQRELIKLAYGPKHAGSSGIWFTFPRAVNGVTARFPV